MAVTRYRIFCIVRNGLVSGVFLHTDAAPIANVAWCIYLTSMHIALFLCLVRVNAYNHVHLQLNTIKTKLISSKIIKAFQLTVLDLFTFCRFADTVIRIKLYIHL